jgi:hypothetical protein
MVDQVTGSVKGPALIGVVKTPQWAKEKLGKPEILPILAELPEATPDQLHNWRHLLGGETHTPIR